MNRQAVWWRHEPKIMGVDCLMPKSKRLVKGSKAGGCTVIAVPKKSQAKANGKLHAQKLSQAEARLNNLKSLTNFVIENHRSWIAKNPRGTLRDLLERLELALGQCQEIISRSGDVRICEHPCIPEPLDTELAEWDNSDEECTFSYREANLEELLGNADELAEEVGYEFTVSALKDWQPK